MKGIPSGIIAGCFALAAFAVAIVAGLSAGNPAPTILLRAVIALIICYPVGLLVDALCRRIIVAGASEPGRDAGPDDRTNDIPTTVEPVEEAADFAGSREPVAAS